MAQMYKLIADIGGITYKSNPPIKISGDGPMAGLLEKIGNVSFSSTVTKVETGRLADDLFVSPQNYKIVRKK